MTDKKQIKRSKPKTTSQDIASIFNTHLSSIKDLLNRFRYRRDDPEIAGRYNDYQLNLIPTLLKITEKYLKVELPELPTLGDDDCYTGLIRLAGYFLRALKQLNEIKSKPDPKFLYSYEQMEVTYKASERQIRRLCQKYHLEREENRDKSPGARNRMRIYTTDFNNTIPNGEKLEYRDAHSKNKLLAKRKERKQIQAQKK